MRNKEGKSGSPPAVGGVSLLVVFAVLCLTVFALLSLSSVRADERLSLASAQAVSAYYDADCAAQEILARLRLGELPDGVQTDGTTYSYRCAISETQVLIVELERRETEFFVLRWQAAPAGSWEADAHLNVWDGSDE